MRVSANFLLELPMIRDEIESAFRAEYFLALN